MIPGSFVDDKLCEVKFDQVIKGKCHCWQNKRNKIELEISKSKFFLFK